EAEAGEDHDQLPPAVGSTLEDPHPPARPTELTWQEAVELIEQITGISERAAQGVLAELGRDRGRFESRQARSPLLRGSVPAITSVRASDTRGKAWPRHFLSTAAPGKDVPLRRRRARICI